MESRKTNIALTYEKLDDVIGGSLMVEAIINTLIFGITAVIIAVEKFTYDGQRKRKGKKERDRRYSRTCFNNKSFGDVHLMLYGRR